MGKTLRNIVLITAGGLSLLGCKKTPNAQLPESYSAHYVSKSRTSKFPVSAHSVDEAPEGFRIQRGAANYLISREGQLLTSWFHEVRRVDGKLYLQRGEPESGGTIIEESIPTSYDDFMRKEFPSPEREDCVNHERKWLNENFEERDGGLYARDWELFQGKRD